MNNTSSTPSTYNNSDSTIDLLKIKIEQAKDKLPVETSNAIAAVDWKAAILSLREKRGYNFEQLGDLETETELVLCGLLNPSDYPKEIQNRLKISKAETDELVNELNVSIFKKIKEEMIKNTERKKDFNQKVEKKEPVVKRESAVKGVGIQRGEPVLEKSGIELVKSINTDLKNSININTPPEKREDIIKILENTNVKPAYPILQQKILGSIQAPVIKTNHTLENLSSVSKDKKINVPQPIEIYPTLNKTLTLKPLIEPTVTPTVTPTAIPIIPPTKNKIPKVDPYREIPE